MKKRFNFLLAGLVLTALSADAAADETASGGSGWSIHSGPVEWRPGKPVSVSGRFEVRAPAGGPTAHARPLQGGACLVADLVPFGIGRANCSTHADCNEPDAIDRASDARLADYVGYCAARDGGADARKCWTRPGSASLYCRRTVDSLSLTPGAHELGPVGADPLRNGPPYPDWAVYACLAHPGHDRACGETESSKREVSLTPAGALEE